MMLARHVVAVPKFLGQRGLHTKLHFIRSRTCVQNRASVMSTTHPFGMHYHRHHLGSSHFAAIRIYSSQRPPNAPRNRITSGLGMLGAGGLVLMGKGKYILGALKLTKFASLGSMLVTIGAYTAFYGFPYALGMTSLILIHESGHALVMKKLGIPFSPMVFVPFMGAAVAMKQRPKDAYEEALVAFGGPILGSVGALGFAGAAHVTGSPLLFALADFGFMINLFNLIPLGMMDGGEFKFRSIFISTAHQTSPLTIFCYLLLCIRKNMWSNISICWPSWAWYRWNSRVQWHDFQSDFLFDSSWWRI